MGGNTWFCFEDATHMIFLWGQNHGLTSLSFSHGIGKSFYGNSECRENCLPDLEGLVRP